MNYFNVHLSKYIVSFIVIFSTFLFFFRLDYTPLSSWDEAWYGSIAREIVQSGDWMYLRFNNIPYYDHPPMGFWLMALSYHIFGVSELSTRLPSAFAGVGSSILLYFLSIKLIDKKSIGLAAVLVLNTCVWYVLRGRSGNLDALFVFFSIAAVYFAIKTQDNAPWFMVSMMFFGALVLTKTLAGISLIIPICWFAVPKLVRKRKYHIYLILSLILFGAIVIPWYRMQIVKYPEFFSYHFYHIGARDQGFESLSNIFTLQWQLPVFYLHMGVRKWFKLWIIGLILLTGSVIYRIIENAFRFVVGASNKLNAIENSAEYRMIGILLWISVVLLPYLRTNQTQIWHLIPVYPSLAIITAFGLYILLVLLPQFAFKNSVFKNIPFLTGNYLYATTYLLVFIFISMWQVKVFYQEIFPMARYTVDEVDILKKAKLLQGSTIYVDRDYVPIAVFYSEKIVKEYTREQTDEQTIEKVFNENGSQTLAVSNNILSAYTGRVSVLKRNRTFAIVTDAENEINL